MKNNFPILNQKVNGKALVYLDNAATSQKPLSVINKIEEYYKETNSNIHRGAHFLANKATEEYEASRDYVAKFINSEKSSLVNFVRGTTEAINLVAYAFGDKYIGAADEIIISELEHHSNIVPWQMLCERTGAKLKVIPINEAGELIISEYEKLLSDRTKLVSVAYVSNALGTINPVKEMIQMAHKVGAKILLDAAQAAPHIKIDVQDLDCDFLAFSAHKVYGPTGIGILYGKEDVLNAMNPFHGGGEMISNVTFEKTTYNKLPYKFEAGTPNICGSIALAEALKFVDEIGIENIAKHENDLLEYATKKMLQIEGLKIYGTAKNKSGVVSFLIDGIHPYDLGVLLDKQGIAIRTGNHCNQPLMAKFNIEGTCRASFAIYNTTEDVDVLVKGINKAVMMLS
ncbi:MAG: cysteine desulfurase/selenocysteine lyase [Planctomycetota bacterium]|jgi:cysteine desulfurase/selenocysteine lyase